MMKLFAPLVYVFTGLLALTGCSSVDILNSTIPSSGYSVHKDIAYGAGPRQHLDIYVPDGLTEPAGVIVFYYGGSWKMGKKEDYLFAGQAFASKGYVTVIADYRLYPEVYFPDFMHDSAQALVWVHNHIADYGGDAKKLFVVGHSAGGYIAVMLATNDAYIKEADGKPSWISGAIGIAGPYDFLPITDPIVKKVFSREAPEKTQPITFVKPGLPPMLLLWGDADEEVWGHNSKNMAAKLRANGNSVTETIYPEVGHIGIILALARGFRGKAPTLDDTDAFIRATTAARPR